MLLSVVIVLVVIGLCLYARNGSDCGTKVCSPVTPTAPKKVRKSAKKAVK